MNTARSSFESKNTKKLSDTELAQLWDKYAQDKKDKATRDKLIVQYLYLTKYVVNRLRVSLPASISTDDIAGYGVEGLMNAVDRFEPSKGARFETYALMRIRGAIIDKIRSQDWIPRGTRKRFKDIQQCIQKFQGEQGRTPTPAEIGELLGITKEKVQSTLTEMENNTMRSLHDKRDNSGEGMEILDTIEDTNAKNPLQELEEKDIKKDLSMALSRLPERERMILALYYHENMTLKEIGEAISISESRVCQLHAQAIMKLRSLLTTNKLRLRKSIV